MAVSLSRRFTSIYKKHLACTDVHTDLPQLMVVGSAGVLFNPHPLPTSPSVVKGCSPSPTNNCQGVCIETCCGALQKPGEGLLVELDERRMGRPTSGAAVAAQWFAQDLFNDAGLAQEEEEEEADTPLPSKAQKPKLTRQTAKPSSAPHTGTAVSVPTQIQGREARTEKAAAAAAAVSADPAASSSAEDSDSSLHSESSSSDDEEERMASVAASREVDDKPDQSGFEEVPVSRQHGDGSSDESSDDGFDELDEDGRAEVLALAKKMLKGRDRQDIMDNAYHKYAFHETGLPRWFEEDEKRHMK